MARAPWLAGRREAAGVMYKLLSKSLDRYYEALSRTGYRNQEVLNKLLMLCAMADLTSTYLRGLITSCDLRLLDSAAHKLLDKCIIREPKLEGDMINRLGLLENTQDAMPHRFARLAHCSAIETVFMVYLSPPDDLPCKDKKKECTCKQIKP